MKSNTNCWRSVVAAIGIIFGAAIAQVPLAFAQNLDYGVLPPQSNPYGMTYGEWSARWWQWILSIPTSVNPLLDPTGADCGQGQLGPVWFLAGTFGGSASRACTIPAGKSILFPILNAECSTVEGNGTTDKALRACAMGLIDHATKVEADIDGRSLVDLTGTPPVSPFRVQSPLFNFTLPSDNILGITNPDPNPSPSVSDGYWIILAPLSVGEHIIHFRGEVPVFSFTTEATYTITVQ
jgi:hypothetical protein